MTRGEILHNPFDIEKSNINWRGMVVSGSDNTFVEFVSDVMGIRAGFLDIKNSIAEGNNTITKLITKFAPPNENDTEAYIKNVSERTGIDADAIIQPFNLKQLGISIIIQEQGSCIYSDATISEAMVLAGINT